MNPAHDTVNPPGCVVNQDKPLSYMIDDFKRCSSGYEKQADGCCHKTVIERCSDCSYPLDKQEKV